MNVDKKTFKEIINNYILPLFAGTEIRDGFDAPAKKHSKQFVVQPPRNAANIQQLVPDFDSDYCLTLKRTQGFNETEVKLLNVFLKNAKERNLYANYQKPYFFDIANSIVTQAISEVLNIGDISHEIITAMLQWSQETYEGQNISMSIGVDINRQFDEKYNTFADIKNEDFLKLLGNGFDTILVINKENQLVSLEPLEECSNSDLCAPFRFLKIANWTTTGRVAFVLNRNHEILIFKDQELCFAHRRGHWSYFSHALTIKQLYHGWGTGKASHPIRRAVYLSCLDVAFSKGGGCIGYIQKKKFPKKDSYPWMNSDCFRLTKSSLNIKASTLKSLIAGKKFQDIPRLLRVELIAIDGATIISLGGEIITVGAILRIKNSQQGTTAGGRTLAAMFLSEYGIGIKVSNDGYCNVYVNSTCILKIG